MRNVHVAEIKRILLIYYMSVLCVLISSNDFVPEFWFLSQAAPRLNSVNLAGRKHDRRSQREFFIRKQKTTLLFQKFFYEFIEISDKLWSGDTCNRWFKM